MGDNIRKCRIDMEEIRWQNQKQLLRSFFFWQCFCLLEKVVAATWFVLIITMLLLTYYDTVYSKKEQMVRIVLGADLIHMMTHKIISDIVGFLILLFCNGLVIVLGMGIGKHLQIKSIASPLKKFLQNGEISMCLPTCQD